MLKIIGASILGVVVGLLLAGAVQDDAVGGVYTTITPSFSEGVTVAGSSTFDTSTLVVDGSSDEVGIGTASPSAILHVENPSATTTVYFSTGAASKGARLIFEDKDGAGCTEVAYLNGTAVSQTVTCP